MKSASQEWPSDARSTNGVQAPAKRRSAWKPTFDKKKFEHEFEFQCRAHDLPAVVTQFAIANSLDLLNKRRRYRFDFGFPDFNLLVEINGGIWLSGGGAHSHPLDVERNQRKQNDATLWGYYVLQFTPDEVTNRHAISFTQKVLFARGWRNAHTTSHDS